MHAPLQLKNDYLNVLLDAASERTRDRSTRIYELELGISVRDVRLLRMIAGSPGLTMGQLVTLSCIEKTLVSKHVSSLVQRNLVERSIGTEDARQIQLCLTQLGIDLVMRAEPMGHEMEARLVEYLSEAEIATLKRVLQKIIDVEAASRDAFEARLAHRRKMKLSEASAPPNSNVPTKR